MISFHSPSAIRFGQVKANLEDIRKVYKPFGQLLLQQYNPPEIKDDPEKPLTKLDQMSRDLDRKFQQETRDAFKNLGEKMAEQVERVVKEANDMPFVKDLDRFGIDIRIEVLPEGFKQYKTSLPDTLLCTHAKSAKYITAAKDTVPATLADAEESRQYRLPVQTDWDRSNVASFYLKPDVEEYNPKLPALAVSIESKPGSAMGDLNYALSKMVRTKRLIWQKNPMMWVFNSSMFKESLSNLKYPLLLAVANFRLNNRI